MKTHDKDPRYQNELTQKAELLRLLTRLRKETRWCLPNSQDSQSKVETEDLIGTTDRSFWNDRWPRHQCQSRTRSSWPATKPVRTLHRPNSTCLLSHDSNQSSFQLDPERYSKKRKKLHFSYFVW